MAKPWNVNAESSGAFRMSNEDIDEEWLLDCENNKGVEFNELDTEPLVQEHGGWRY